MITESLGFGEYVHDVYEHGEEKFEDTVPFTRDSYSSSSINLHAVLLFIFGVAVGDLISL